jgi:hypothetical protein
LARIAGNTTLYLFFVSLIVLFLYVMGNVQGFLDDTLLLLLRVFEWILFALCVTDVYYGVFSVVRLVRGGGGYAAPLKAAVGFIYGAGMLILVNFMFSWFFW